MTGTLLPAPRRSEHVACALERAGVRPPDRFTAEIVFRRCTACSERNLVKERGFVCVFCDADLPAERNAGRRRAVP